MAGDDGQPSCMFVFVSPLPPLSTHLHRRPQRLRKGGANATKGAKRGGANVTKGARGGGALSILQS